MPPSIKRFFKVSAAAMFVFLLSFGIANAQVVINEVSPASSPEWVELYKTAEGEFSFDGCTLFLHDDESTTQKVTFSTSDLFGADEKYKQVSWTSSWLNNGGDTVILKCEIQLDRVTYGSGITSTKSYGRIPDGTGDFTILDEATPGSSNSPSLPTPTPTPTPEPQPTPTETEPTPTDTPTPTPTPAPNEAPPGGDEVRPGKLLTCKLEYKTLKVLFTRIQIPKLRCTFTS